MPLTGGLAVKLEIDASLVDVFGPHTAIVGTEGEDIGALGFGKLLIATKLTKKFTLEEFAQFGEARLHFRKTCLSGLVEFVNFLEDCGFGSGVEAKQ